MQTTDEPYGPLVVCGLIFVAVLLNFILRIKNRCVLSLLLLLSPLILPLASHTQLDCSRSPRSSSFVVVVVVVVAILRCGENIPD